MARRKAQVAQLVEQRTENPRVGGSIPPLGTIQESLESNTQGFFYACRKMPALITVERKQSNGLFGFRHKALCGIHFLIGEIFFHLLC